METALRTFRRRLQVCLPLYLGWAVSYELVGRCASHLRSTDVSLAVDTMIPFRPGWVWIYGLTYVVPFIALLVIRDDAVLNRALIAVTIASCVGYVVFVTYPVVTLKPELGAGVSNQLLGMLRRLDVPANQLPSLHVANAWILFRAVTSEPRKLVFRILAAAAAFAIAVSTLFVKQHVVLDAAAGVATGAFAFQAAKKLLELWRDFGARAGHVSNRL